MQNIQLSNIGANNMVKSAEIHDTAVLPCILCAVCHKLYSVAMHPYYCLRQADCDNLSIVRLVFVDCTIQADDSL